MPPANLKRDPISAEAEWFHIRKAGDDIYVIEEPGHVQSYLVNGRRRSALIDTGLGLAPLKPALMALAHADMVVLNTHWHFDHVMGNPEFETIAIARGEQRLIQRAIDSATLRRLYIDACLAAGPRLPRGFAPADYHYPGSVATRLLEDGDRIDLGGRHLTVLATPGHTRGSLSFLDASTGALFCGDLVYAGTLYAHFADSDTDAYIASLKALADHDVGIRQLFPGHNRFPLSTAWLPKACQLLEAAIENQKPFTMTTEWGPPVRRHQGDGLDLLTPAPGTEGVDLAAALWPASEQRV